MTKKHLSPTVKFWYPISATFEDATASVEIKAPVFNNSVKLGRNQTIHRTRSGKVQVYDRGIDYNNVMRLQFQDMTDTERSNLVSFLSAVQWGMTKLVYRDMYGDERFVRCNVTAIEYTDTGLATRNTPSGDEVMWNFNVDFLDISDNLSELSEADPEMSTALLLHITDYDDPHAPETVIAISNETNKVVEEISTQYWKNIYWFVTEEKGSTLRNTRIIAACCDGDLASTVASNTDINDSLLTSLGGMPGAISYNLNLSGGTFTTQVLQLRATTTETDWTIRVRRIKLK